MFPLFNFFGSLGIKYAVGIIIIAIAISIAIEVFLADRSASHSVIAMNSVVLSAMLFLLAFIVFIVYKVYTGESFQFASLTASSTIILFATSLLIAVRATLSDSSGFHLVQVLLALGVSLSMGALFSAVIKVAQRFISAS